VNLLLNIVYTRKSQLDTSAGVSRKWPPSSMAFLYFDKYRNLITHSFQRRVILDKLVLLRSLTWYPAQRCVPCVPG